MFQFRFRISPPRRNVIHLLENLHYKVLLLSPEVFLLRTCLALSSLGLMFSVSNVTSSLCLQSVRDGRQSRSTPSMLRKSSKNPFQSADHHLLKFPLGIHLALVFLISMY